MMPDNTLSLLAVLAAPLIFPGIINRVKAVWAGRRGAPLLQSFYDLRKLLGKGVVISRTTSFVLPLCPSVQVASAVFASLLVPLPGRQAFLSFPGDFILFAYVLGLARFMMVIAALDTGSSFEGMGASREVTFAVFMEPAFFLLLGSLALVTGQTSFASIFSLLGGSKEYNLLVQILCALSLFVMLLTEGARVPVDDPNTHLELTMVHEVMILDYSGPDLAFISYAASLKMVLFATLMADVLISAEYGVYGIYLWCGMLITIAAGIGTIESLLARVRISHVPQFIFLATALAAATFAIALFFHRGGW